MFFVIGGRSKIGLTNDNTNVNDTLFLIMKIIWGAFINCYLLSAIIIMILITYSALFSSWFDPMAKESHYFANLKAYSGTDTEGNDHLMSTGCDLSINILLISCGDIEQNHYPSLPILFWKKWKNDEADQWWICWDLP